MNYFKVIYVTHSLGNTAGKIFAAVRIDSKMHSSIQANQIYLKSWSIYNGWCPHERYMQVLRDPGYRLDC